MLSWFYQNTLYSKLYIKEIKFKPKPYTRFYSIKLIKF